MARDAGGRARARALLSTRGWLVPIAVSALIVAWQLDFNADIPSPSGYEVTASQGLLPDLRYFFYFYYHLGLFPVGARAVPRLGPSHQDALDFVARSGKDLRMDFGEVQNTPRFGDYGKLFVFLPGVILGGSPARPSARAFNELLFIAALIAVWWAFWREHRPLLGVLLVLLVGSNPFQLFETYTRANIFSLPISVTLLALAPHLPYLSGRKPLDRRAIALAAGCGVLLATVREIRVEAAVVALAIPVTYCTAAAPWRRRLAASAVFVLAFCLAGAAWKIYWRQEWDRSARFVSQAGGQTFTARHSSNHALWHAVYCGLGDFGGDRGFHWEDREAFRWATTADALTNPRPLPYHYREGYYLEETYDGVNHIAPTDLPEYNRLIRNRVLAVIGSHPLWYARILGQRVVAVLDRATPASIVLGSSRLQVPGAGWLLLPIVLAMGWLRRGFELKVVLFTLPLATVALLIYSGRGLTSYGIAHLAAVAVLLDQVARWIPGLMSPQRMAAESHGLR